MDFRIRSNYNRAFLRIPEFVETNPSEKSEKGNWISVQCWILMCFSWFFSWIWMMREHSFQFPSGALIRSSWWKKCRLQLATSWLSDMGFTRWWNGGYEMDRNDEFAGPGCDDHVWDLKWDSQGQTCLFVGRVSILYRSFWEIYWFHGGWKILHYMNYMFIMDYNGL